MKVKLNGNDFYEVSTKFGITDDWHSTVHTGIDLVMNTGTQLFSPVDGTISKIVDYGSENIGKGIFIKTDSGENVIMGHLSDVKASIGDRVSEGDLVALSGNTGHSSGSHLHLGLKGEDGTFLDPEPLLAKGDGKIGWDKFLENGKVNQYHNDSAYTDKGFMEFINDWREHGFWEAMYDKSFFEVCSDFFSQLFHDIGLFILGNADMFFLMPAIVLMVLTFFIGKNKYTKLIVPLWFVYFVSTVFHKMML